MTPNWKVWRNRRGRVKGVAIVFPASDYGLELHTGLSPEHHEDFCVRLCEALNASSLFRATEPQGEKHG